MQKGLKLDLAISKKLQEVLIESDKLRIRQILLNLLSNSLKFTFKGSISVNAKLYKTHDDDFVEVKVKDTGIGIKEEDKPKLFKLFSQLSDQRINPNGSGIGLTISRKYLEKLGGEILAESQEGEGT